MEINQNQGHKQLQIEDCRNCNIFKGQQEKYANRVEMTAYYQHT